MELTVGDLDLDGVIFISGLTQSRRCVDMKSKQSTSIWDGQDETK